MGSTRVARIAGIELATTVAASSTMAPMPGGGYLASHEVLESLVW
jgi:hypothetical protein